MQRYHPPLASIAQWERGRVSCNICVLESIHSSSDMDLDKAAFDKSLAERDRGVLLGPFEVGEDFAIGDACHVPRRGIWELHGGATEPTCRVIDDLLFGEHISTVERFSSHRPTDVDGLVAQVRAVATRFPHRAMSGWPIDFAKAYEQVLGDPAQFRCVVVAQWCPYRCRPILWVARSQLFGGSSSPPPSTLRGTPLGCAKRLQFALA